MSSEQTDVELQALAAATPSDAPHDSADFGYDAWRSLGDLIVDAFAPNLSAWGDGAGAPADWHSFDYLVAKLSALELHAVSRALRAGAPTEDDGPIAEAFTPKHAAILLDAIGARMRAAAELGHRLRKARWGNPHFGGGEKAAESEAP